MSVEASRVQKRNASPINARSFRRRTPPSCMQEASPPDRPAKRRMHANDAVETYSVHMLRKPDVAKAANAEVLDHAVVSDARRHPAQVGAVERTARSARLLSAAARSSSCARAQVQAWSRKSASAMQRPKRVAQRRWQQPTACPHGGS